MKHFVRTHIFAFLLSILAHSVYGNILNDGIADITEEIGNQIGKLKYVPDYMDFNVVVDNKNVKLKLKRNKNIDKISNCFVIRRDKTGKEVLVREHLQFEANVGLYQDVHNGASISIKCDRLEAGVCDSTLTGTVYLEGEEYSIEGLRNETAPTASPARGRNRINRRKKYNISKRRKHKAPRGISRKRKTNRTRSNTGKTGRRRLSNVSTDSNRQAFIKDAREVSASTAEILGQNVVSTVVESAAASIVTDTTNVNNKLISYDLELLTVIDYSLYRRFLDQQPTSADEQERSLKAMSAVKAYFDQVINGVDVRFKSLKSAKYEINVIVSSYIIADTPNYPTWNYNFSSTVNSRHPVPADDTIDKLEAWKNSVDLPEHDHVMLFTNHDLYVGDPRDSNALLVTGFAPVGKICGKKSVSVVEDHGAFESVLTATHELAHSFGVKHDGEGNTCSPNDQFLMTDVSGNILESNKFNPWKFSPCSIEAFDKSIASFQSNKKNCLLLDALIYDKEEFTRNTAKLPGQLLNPNEQCRAHVGNSSYYGWGGILREFKNICTHMACKTNASASSYMFFTAARGTSCGNKMWCIDGKCIPSETAERKPGTCVHGDSLREFPEFSGQTCKEVIVAFPGFCYDKYYRDFCCESCALMAVGKPRGCQYGDRSMSCTAVYTSPFLCYTNERRCCESCTNVKLGPPGCEYLDKQKDCNSNFCVDIPGNEAYRENCCNTCGLADNRTRTTTTSTTTTTTTVVPTTTTAPVTTLLFDNSFAAGIQRFMMGNALEVGTSGVSVTQGTTKSPRSFIISSTPKPITPTPVVRTPPFSRPQRRRTSAQLPGSNTANSQITNTITSSSTNTTQVAKPPPFSRPQRRRTSAQLPGSNTANSQITNTITSSSNNNLPVARPPFGRQQRGRTTANLPISNTGNSSSTNTSQVARPPFNRPQRGRTSNQFPNTANSQITSSSINKTMENSVSGGTITQSDRSGQNLCLDRNATFGVVSCNSLTHVTDDICISGSSSIRQSCCKTCPVVDSCVDQPGCKIRKARECYVDGTKCCASCKKYRTGIKDCEYGDKRKFCANYFKRFPDYVCSRSRENCCQTCKDAPVKNTKIKAKPKPRPSRKRPNRLSRRKNRFFSRFSRRERRPGSGSQG